MKLFEFADMMSEAIDYTDEYLKQAAAVDPNAEFKPRMLISPENAKAELARRAAATPKPEVSGTLKAGDGSTVVSGDGTPVQAGTQPAPAPAPAPAAEPAVATPVAPQGHVDAVPLPPATTPAGDNSGAPPAAATNFDSMSFGNAFKTARNQGLKQFTWKGKPYTTDLAKPATPAPAPQAGSSQKVAPEFITNPKVQPPVMDPKQPGFDFKKASAYATGQQSDQKAAPTTGPQGQPLVQGPDGKMGYYLNPVVKKGWTPVQEGVGFTNESLDRIVSLVHYR